MRYLRNSHRKTPSLQGNYLRVGERESKGLQKISRHGISTERDRQKIYISVGLVKLKGTAEGGLRDHFPKYHNTLSVILSILIHIDT